MRLAVASLRGSMCDDVDETEGDGGGTAEVGSASRGSSVSIPCSDKEFAAAAMR